VSDGVEELENSSINKADVSVQGYARSMFLLSEKPDKPTSKNIITSKRD
jgi:hypothetical protein